MVRITNSVYHEAYDYIKRDSTDGNCIVFVASDVDSICAIRIFQALLKSDIIPHKIVPVSGYKDLVTANEKLVRKDVDLRSIVMINCGGLGNITECFNLTPFTKVYIIDSHRPLNLENMHASNTQVCVFDDDSETEKIAEVLEAYDAVYQEDNDDSEAESSEENDSDDSEGRTRDNRARQKRRMNDDADLSRGMKRNLRRRQHRLLADYYAGGSYYANSVSGAIYELVSQLGKTNNEILWLAIIGVTSKYIFEQMDTYKYAEKLEMFKDDRARLNIDQTDNNNGSTMHNPNVVIKSEDEYRFMMFRHWSLYDSMYHSGYVSSKLCVWKDSGRKRLNNMFAKMGFSLQQCQQVYTHMDMDLKDMLRRKIEVVAPLYGLTDICFPSFTRSYGWECCLSASDVVYALSTILETSPAAAIRLGVSVNWNEKEDGQSLENADDILVNGLGSNRHNWWMRNFYTAYDALNGSSPDSILRGLKLCMKTQKAIVRQGTAIIDKRMAKLINNFRFVNIRNGPDISIFQHPLTLAKLALFLTDAYREHGKKNLPFVISSLDEEHHTCLLLSSYGAPTFGEVRKNTFGLAYEEAAEKTGARVSFDSFEASIVQVHDGDIEHFVETLYYKTR